MQEENKKKIKEKPKETIKVAKKFSLKKIIKFSLKLILGLLGGVIVLVTIFLVALNFIITPSLVEKQITENFNKQFNAKISLNVEKFKIYSGFKISNIKIINTDKQFKGQKLISIDRFVLDYSFFKLFCGNIYFPEIGIYHPEIHVKEKNGLLNLNAIFKETKKSTLQEPQKKEKEIAKNDNSNKNKEDKIVLPIKIKMLFNFILKDFACIYENKNQKIVLNGLNFETLIYFTELKEIPLSLKATTLLKNFKILLNPKKNLKIKYWSKTLKTNPSIVLAMSLDYKKKNSTIVNDFNFGTKNLPVQFKRTVVGPLNFLLSYNVVVNPITDIINLNKFQINFQHKEWLNLTGKIKKISTTREFNFKINNSNINLGDLHRVYSKLFPGSGIYFRGDLSLAPFNISGNLNNNELNNLLLNGTISLRHLYLNLKNKTVTMPALYFNYSLAGNLNNLKIKTKIKSSNFKYSMDGSQSGWNRIALIFDAKIFNNFNLINIDNLNFRLINPVMGLDALSLAMNGTINLAGDMGGKIILSKLKFFKAPTVGIVAEKFKQKVEKIPLEQPITLKSMVNFSLGKNIIAKAIVNFNIPDYKMPDLKLRADVKLSDNNKQVRINNFSISSLLWNLKFRVYGFLKRYSSPFSDSNLKISLDFKNKKIKKLYKDWLLSGNVHFFSHIVGSIKTGKTSGTINFKNLIVKNKKKKLFLKNFNLNFPYEFFFKSKYKGKSLIAATKNSVINNSHFQREKNIFIEKLTYKHPKRDIAFSYMENLQGSIFFKDNALQIENLSTDVMNGNLYIRSILFNLANLDLSNASTFKKDNVEFRFNMDATNIDIDKLDNPDKKTTSFASQLSLSSNFHGRGLDIKKELNVTGYINIYKIGEKFANKLFKGLSSQKGKSKLGALQPIVDNTLIPTKFNFILSNGLMYSTVYFKKKILGNLIGIENQKINFDRIPIQEYLRKVSKGD